VKLLSGTNSYIKFEYETRSQREVPLWHKAVCKVSLLDQKVREVPLWDVEDVDPMHAMRCINKFNIQQLYAQITLYLCVV
jgi:hypothetical protein